MNSIDFDNWLQTAKESMSVYEKSLAKVNEHEIDMNKVDPKNFEESLMKLIEENRGPEYYEATENFFSLLEKMFRVYLDSSPDERNRIRNAFSGKKHLLNFLIGYPDYVSKFIHSKDDVIWVQMGLIAALIEGGMIDFRDLWVSLGALYLKAKSCGINFDEQVAFVESLEQIYSDSFPSVNVGKTILSDFLSSAYLESVT